MKLIILALLGFSISMSAFAKDSMYSCALNDQSFQGGDIGFGNREVPLRFRLSLGDNQGEKQLVMSWREKDVADAYRNGGSTNDEYYIGFKNESWSNETQFGKNTGINLLRINGSAIDARRESHDAEAMVSVHEITELNFDEQSLTGKLLEVGNVDSVTAPKANIYKSDFTCSKIK